MNRCCRLHKKTLSSILLSKLIPSADELLRLTDVNFDVIGQRLIRSSISVTYSTGEKVGV
jgi:hypothetical protein